MRLEGVSILDVDDELRLHAGDSSSAVPTPGGESAADGPASAERYVVERRQPTGWVAVGEVGLDAGSVTLEIAAECRRQGIGRRVLLRVVDRARALGWSELGVSGVADSEQPAVGLLSGLGFVQRPGEPTAYVLRLAPLGSRPRP